MAELETLRIIFPTSRESPTPPTVQTLLPTVSIGPRVPGYRLFRLLGRGGMGAVYEAEQLDPQRRVAVKLISAPLTDAEAVARFAVERQAVARLDHSNIAKVFEAGTTPEGLPFFAMELVGGLSLMDYCQSRQLRVRERLVLFVAVCRAVQHAHQKGVIHRDLKPTNILVAEVDGHAVPKVIDFGLAKLVAEGDPHLSMTQAGNVAGTPLYMAPEQATTFTKSHVDTRTDVYGLGVVLYELLAGRTPLAASELQGLHPFELLSKVREYVPLAPSTVADARLTMILRGELDWIVLKCLEKEPDRRYPTADQLADDIERFLNDQPVLARPASRWYVTRKFVKRNRTTVAVSAALLLLLLGGIVGTSIGFVRSERMRAIADERAEAEAAARAKASDRYRVALKAYQAMIYSIQDKLENRPGLQDLRQDLLTNARKGLVDLLRDPDPQHNGDEALAWAHYRLGDLEQHFGNPQEAISRYREGLAIAEVGYAEQPENVASKRSVAVGHMKLVDTFVSQGNLEEAGKSAQVAHDFARDLAQRYPEEAIYQRDYYIGLNKLGDHQLGLGQYQQTIGYYRKSFEVFRQLEAKGQLDTAGRRDGFVASNKIGECLLRLGRFEEALTSYQDGANRARALAKAEPKNILAQRDAAISEFLLGDARFKLQQQAKATEHFEKFFVAVQELARQEPQHLLLKQDLAAAQDRLGELAFNKRDYDNALTLYRQSEVLYRELSASTRTPKNHNGWASLLRKLGDVQVKLFDIAAARQTYQKAREQAPEKDKLFFTTRLNDCDVYERSFHDSEAPYLQSPEVVIEFVDFRIHYLLKHGKREEAVATAERFAKWANQVKEHRGMQQYNAAYLFAICAAGPPMKAELVDKAIACLEAAKAGGYFTPIHISHFREDVDFKPLRTHPKLVAFDASLNVLSAPKTR